MLKLKLPKMNTTVKASLFTVLIVCVIIFFLTLLFKYPVDFVVYMCLSIIVGLIFFAIYNIYRVIHKHVSDYKRHNG
jgi:uncharacterized protein (DUF983 family)